MENWLPSLTTPRTTAAYDLVIDLPRMAMGPFNFLGSCGTLKKR